MKKYSQILLSIGVISTTIMFSSPVFAEGEIVNNAVEETSVEEQQQKEPGMTPDNPFYFLDKFGEKIQLLFTGNIEKESNLYLQFAEERLAESTKMADASKDKYITDLIDAYVTNLGKAQEVIAEVVIDESVSDKVKNELITNLEATTTTSTERSVENVLNEKQAEKLKNKKQEAYLVANMIKEMDIIKVKALREKGLGFGEIVQVIAFADESGKTESEIATLLQKDKKRFDQIAKEINIKPDDILRKINNKKQMYLKSAYKNAVKSGNKEAIEELGLSIESIKKEKETLEIAEDYAEIEDGIKEKLGKIQEKVAAGKITQEKADIIIQKIKKKSEKKIAELKQESIEDLEEIEEDSKEDIEEDKEKVKKKEDKKLAKRAKDEAKTENKVVSTKEKQQEKDAKDKSKADAKEKETKDKTAEKVKEEQDKAAENAKKEQDKAAENAKKEQDKAVGNAKKEQDKATENAKKESDKAAENLKKEQDKAAENAKKEQAKAAENAKKEQEKAAENLKKAQEKAAKEKEKQDKKAQENKKKDDDDED